MGLSETNSSRENILHEPALLVSCKTVVTKPNLLQLKYFLFIALIFSALLPSFTFAQSADPQNDWVSSSPWVAVPPHAPFAEQKVYLQSDSRKHYPVLIFEQLDSVITGGNASQLMYFYKWTNFNTPSPIPAYVEIEACVEDISKNPDIQISLYVYFGNTKTGGWSQSGTQDISNEWNKYLFDFNGPDVPKQYNIFSIGIMMGPSDQRMTSKMGLSSIIYYDSNKNIVWNYNLATSVPKIATQPNFQLEQNYPNPFNPSTTIKFSIPNVGAEHVQPLHVLLKVYDLLGREIATLVNEEKSPGNYEVKFDPDKSGQAGANLPSGVYFYRLTAGSFSQTKKMLLMK